MQSRWKTWPQQPKAIERPFSLFGEGFAWYSMDGSLSEFLQMAQVSAQMSQDHMQTCVGWRRWRRGGSSVGRRPRGSHLVDAETRTAFHFLISKRGGGGSSFFSSAAGPSLVSIALMAQGP